MTRRRPTPTQPIDPKNTTPHRMGSVQMGADGQVQLSCQFTVPAGSLCAHGCLLHDLTRVGSEAGRWCAGGVVVVDGDWEVNQVGRQDATAEAHDGRTFQSRVVCFKSYVRNQRPGSNCTCRRLRCERRTQDCHAACYAQSQSALW